MIPPALGIDHRDRQRLRLHQPDADHRPGPRSQRRAEHFDAARRPLLRELGRDLRAAGSRRPRHCIERLEADRVRAAAGRSSPCAVVESHGADGSASTWLAQSYNAPAREHAARWRTYHFEMLNLGYAAYLDFRQFCQRRLPGHPDQSIAKMVAGIDILLFRPDDELRKLARLGVELGLAEPLTSAGQRRGALCAVRSEATAASTGSRRCEAAKEPWFWFSTGAGFYAQRPRLDRRPARLPFGACATTSTKLRPGEDDRRGRWSDSRPSATGSPPSTASCSAPTTTGPRSTASCALARTVYPFVENHNFYVEHWHHSMFWHKVRELGAVLVDARLPRGRRGHLLPAPLRGPDALYDLCTGWATGTPARGPTYWPPEVAGAQARSCEALRSWAPPPALGMPPERGHRAVHGHALGHHRPRPSARGCGPARRRIGRPARHRRLPRRRRGPGAGDHHGRRQLDEVRGRRDPRLPDHRAELGAGVRQDRRRPSPTSAGSCPTPRSSRREYGLPAVVGTGFGTKRIKTGQRIRVDGNTGTVTVLGDPTPLERNARPSTASL